MTGGKQRFNGLGVVSAKLPDFTVLPGSRRARWLRLPPAYSKSERNLQRANAKAPVVSRMQARSAQMHLPERSWFWAPLRS